MDILPISTGPIAVPRAPVTRVNSLNAKTNDTGTKSREQEPLERILEQDLLRNIRKGRGQRVDILV